MPEFLSYNYLKVDGNWIFSSTKTMQPIEYRYDYQGRRVEKKEFNNNTLIKHTKFVYDGNNVVAEYENGTLTKKYLWGEDVSGSMDGAGGVGALLVVTNGSENYYPSYDGNSNIVNYVDENQTSVAKFEYTPFGAIKSENGSLSDQFHYRFSTKYFDNSTGLIVYRYRNYNPQIGKWQTRDPLGEVTKKKQFNLLYGFVDNSPIRYYDYLGQGKFVIAYKKDIDYSKFNIENEASRPSFAYTGFQVHYIPKDSDVNQCEKFCGDIILSQSISSTGWGGKFSHIDATAAERRARHSSGKSCPPKMSPKSSTPYSYYDSPNNTSVWNHRMTAAAICRKRNDYTAWYVIDTVYFIFNQNSRKLTVEGATKGKSFTASVKYPFYYNGRRKLITGKFLFPAGFNVTGTSPAWHWNNAIKKWRALK